MQKLKITDILPSKPVFKLKLHPTKEFSIRPPNMEDHSWFVENYETLQKAHEVIADRHWGEICRICYYLMSSDDRATFPAESVPHTDENGVAGTKVRMGWQILLKSLSGIEEASGMLAALSRALMISNPIIEEAVNAEVKKQLAILNKGK